MICTHEIETGGGTRGIALEPQKNEYISEIQLDPQSGKDNSHTIIERHKTGKKEKRSK
jgi:hypothetical protein